MLFSRTVSKEGPNKGRPFYCCSKPRGQGCDFFEWGDTTGPSTANSYKYKGPSGAARNVGATKKRKCGLCHQEGRTEIIGNLSKSLWRPLLRRWWIRGPGKSTSSEPAKFQLQASIIQILTTGFLAHLLSLLVKRRDDVSARIYDRF